LIPLSSSFVSAVLARPIHCGSGNQNNNRLRAFQRQKNKGFPKSSKKTELRLYVDCHLPLIRINVFYFWAPAK
jgi:hypothetical protein